jgi:hypothetical protein
MPEVAIRFSVGDGRRRRAATWRCWASKGLGKNDVYLACRELGGALKASLHQSGQWHVAFDKQFLQRSAVPKEWPTRLVAIWERPAEVAPGLTLAYRIITPYATVNASVSEADDNIMWIPPPPSGQIVETVIIITKASVTTTGWPGKRSMGTQLVGRFELDNADTVWIVTRVDKEPIFETQLNRARFFHGRTQADVRGPGLRGIAFGTEPDGSRVMYEIVAKDEALADGAQPVDGTV